jgi:hypothetical protein
MIDAWWHTRMRSHSPGPPEWEGQALTWDEVTQIMRLVSDCHMIDNAGASASYVADFDRMMSTLVQDDEARDLIRKYSVEYWS